MTGKRQRARYSTFGLGLLLVVEWSSSWRPLALRFQASLSNRSCSAFVFEGRPHTVTTSMSAIMPPKRRKFHSNPNLSVTYPMITQPNPQLTAVHRRIEPYIPRCFSPKKSNVWLSKTPDALNIDMPETQSRTWGKVWICRKDKESKEKVLNILQNT